jgi:hypothetical protein
MSIPDDVLDTMTDDEVRDYLDSEVADMWLSTTECRDMDFV